MPKWYILGDIFVSGGYPGSLLDPVCDLRLKMKKESKKGDGLEVLWDLFSALCCFFVFVDDVV